MAAGHDRRNGWQGRARHRASDGTEIFYITYPRSYARIASWATSYV
jgi:hypothetical protein